MPFPKLYEHIKGVLELDALAVGPLTPQGVTVHYSAERDAQATVAALKTAGDGYSLGYHILVAQNGDVIQLTSFDKKVYHAGKASWLGLSPNSHHIAISLLSWGQLVDRGGLLQSWTGAGVTTDQAAFRPNNVNGEKCWWDRATLLQETAFLQLCRWLVAKGIPSNAFTGHDECAIPQGRKVDPGGVLSMTMPQLRALLARTPAA
jgi:N-acetylmuramoyl-L-alanine amidase